MNGSVEFVEQGAYKVVHVCAAGNYGSDIISPVSLHGTGAVVCPGRSIPNLVVGRNDGRV